MDGLEIRDKVLALPRHERVEDQLVDLQNHHTPVDIAQVAEAVAFYKGKRQAENMGSAPAPGGGGTSTIPIPEARKSFFGCKNNWDTQRYGEKLKEPATKHTIVGEERTGCRISMADDIGKATGSATGGYDDRLGL